MTCLSVKWRKFRREKKLCGMKWLENTNSHYIYWKYIMCIKKIYNYKCQCHITASAVSSSHLWKQCITLFVIHCLQTIFIPFPTQNSYKFAISNDTQGRASLMWSFMHQIKTQETLSSGSVLGMKQVRWLWDRHFLSYLERRHWQKQRPKFLPRKLKRLVQAVAESQQIQRYLSPSDIQLADRKTGWSIIGSFHKKYWITICLGCYYGCYTGQRVELFSSNFIILL